jgi:hypothetical protein
MPWMLRVLVVLLGVQIVVDVAALATTSGAGLEPFFGGLGLAVDVAVVAGLLHGSEGVRRLVRLAAALGVGYDAVQIARWFGTVPSGADTIAGVLAGSLFAGSLFVFWAVGHRDVQRWMFERWVARTTGS